MKLRKMLYSILCIAMVLGTMSISVFADATIHNVANDTEFAEAISKAIDGDTIKLAAGTYKGGISIGKNIIIEGSIDEDGNPTTIFSGDNGGSYYAYSIYMNKGTIKNIKIVNAWKGIMTEGEGSLTIDNVTMVNIMYGVHIAEAKAAEDIVTIQNCNMDIAWANSFAGGAYSIVIKNNVFTTSDPYYDAAYVINTYVPNTSVSDNVFCKNTRIDVRTEAVAESIEIGNNYYEDGPASVLDGSEYQIPITTCYADPEMTKTVSGTFEGGMVNIENPEATFITTSISNLCAKESIVLKIYDKDGTLLATTSATEKTISYNLSAPSVYTGILGTDLEWWETEWENGKLRADYVPAYGTLYVDGIEMNSASIKMMKTNGEQSINWADVPGVASVPVVAKIGDVEYTTLAEALNSAVATKGGNVTVEILDNIDLTGTTWTPVYFNSYSADNANTIVIEGNKKTITGLSDMMFSGVWTGDKLEIRNLTLDKANIVNDADDTENKGVGAFVGNVSAVKELVITNCHLINSHVEGGHWTGGFVGYAAGYSGNDGPVFTEIAVENCSVTGSTITGQGSVGGVVGHATGDAWTTFSVEDTAITENTITSTGSSTNKAGIVMGTIGAAGTAQTTNGTTLTGGVNVAVTESGNVAKSNETTITTVYGRQGSDTGVLTITGGTYANNPIEENVSYATPAEGYKIVKNEDGTYGVAENNTVETKLINVEGTKSPASELQTFSGLADETPWCAYKFIVGVKEDLTTIYVTATKGEISKSDEKIWKANVDASVAFGVTAVGVESLDSITVNVQ